MNKSKKTLIIGKSLITGVFMGFVFSASSVVALENILDTQNINYISNEISSSKEDNSLIEDCAQSEESDEQKVKVKNNSKDPRRFAIDNEILQNRMKEMGIKVVE